MDSKTTELNELFTAWGADFVNQDGMILPLRVSGAGAEYQAAHEACAIFDGGDRGWMEMSGDDTSDFLQRLLSSDIRTLSTDGVQWSAMLDNKGHWISDLILFGLHRGEMKLIGIDMPTCRQEIIQSKFELMHFSENLSWSAPTVARLMLIGPESPNFLNQIGIDPKASDIDELLVIRRPDRGASCWELVGNSERISDYARRLQQAGALPAGQVALDILRVEERIPRWGADFNQDSTLPESNEWHRASLDKGCYTGQEVVARINTYGKAPRQLCQLDFSGGTNPLHGHELQDENGTTAGVVCSWVWSPVADQAIGMGIVKRKYAHNNFVLKVLGADNGGTARVLIPKQ